MEGKAHFSYISNTFAVNILSKTVAKPPALQQRELGTYVFEKSPGIFRFLTLPLEIPGNTKPYP